MNASADAGQTLDCRGLRCPEPVMLLHDRMRTLGTGERLLVLATDPTTTQDFRRFCGFLGHALEERGDDGEGCLRFVIVKGGQ